MNIEHEPQNNFVKRKRVPEREKKVIPGATIKAKSSLRILYESEVELIKKKYGDIDQIRDELGLTQRQFCKLLMVDPSTYNRWKDAKNGPPPAIWRSISWYMLVREKDPWLSQFLSKTNMAEVDQFEEKLKELSVGIEKNNLKVRNEIYQLKLAALALFLGVTLGYLIHFF